MTDCRITYVYTNDLNPEFVAKASLSKDYVFDREETIIKDSFTMHRVFLKNEELEREIVLQTCIINTIPVATLVSRNYTEMFLMVKDFVDQQKNSILEDFIRRFCLTKSQEFLHCNTKAQKECRNMGSWGYMISNN